MNSLSYATLEQIVQASVQGMLLLEVQGHRARIRYANPAYERMSGYASRELVGNAWSTHFDGDCAFSDAEELNRALMRGMPTVADVSCLRKDGSVWSSHIHLSRVGGAPGDTTLILVQHLLDEPAAAIGTPDREPVQRNTPAPSTDVPAMSGMLAADQFAALLSRDLAIARRHQKSVTLVLFEIMEFEIYRKTFGALTAEACARMVGTQILGTFGRAIDLRARLDARTFAVAVHNPADAAVDRLTQAVADKVLSLSLPNPRSRVSRHIRIATSSVESVSLHEDVAELIERARRQLAGELQQAPARPPLRSAV